MLRRLYGFGISRPYRDGADIQVGRVGSHSVGHRCGTQNETEIGRQCRMRISSEISKVAHEEKTKT